MINWQSLETTDQVKRIVEKSRTTPCLVFKHSTRCSISFVAKHRLEGSWDFGETEIIPYYLDLVARRDVSDYVADHFGVRHESPQILLIQDGQCVLDASHLDVSVARLKDCLASDTVG